MKFPGDLTDEERRHAFDELRALAVADWGEHRAEAMEVSLREASAAITRLGRLRFSRDDAPGFYLHDAAPDQSS